ncbi:SRPBCC family protein [Brevibacterium metallidurans]|uniref:SRPBCC domain-containing protein n=1 Tax=Brevibacterium metallidurans TaxID=1482676 RepID=A0ABN0SSA1_9MICO
MEYGSIERENYVNAPPDVVFQTVSDPKHIKEWWPDSALYEVAEGANGEIRFGDLDSGGIAVQLTIVDVSPPNRFAFRWTHPVGEDASPGNSMLVTFELRPSGEGTLLRFTETGFREMGWEAAVLEEQYREHVQGWDYFLPKLGPYAESLAQKA